MTTDVLDDYGQAHYLQNVRLKRVGELGRRAGLGKSNMAQQAGPVQFLIGGWNYEPYVINGTGGNVTGNADPLPFWIGGQMRIPDGQVGQGVAPVINAITANPLGPAAYPAGMVTFTPNITYDGLSGPLIYSWDNQMSGMFNEAFINGASTNPTAVYDFGVFAFPDNYEALVGLTVSTTLNGFSDNMQYFYTVA
jgi:uncharacterized protein RhaS with RHS repeats